jgi:RNA polymerase sigma factor (sigma-70 family)
VTAEARTSSDTERVIQALEAVHPRLVRILAAFRLSPEEAEDVMQDALVAALTRITEIRALEPWLVGTLCNLSRLRVRRRCKRQEIAYEAVFFKTAQPPEQEQLCLRLDLERSLALLPPGQRQILELRAAGYGPREVAAETGYAKCSLGKLARRALRRLAAFMAAPAAPGCPRGAP